MLTGVFTVTRVGDLTCISKFISLKLEIPLCIVLIKELLKTSPLPAT